MKTIFTIGHSTRPAEEFVALLNAHGVRLLCDVRTIPKSRHNPQFNRDVLPGSLERAQIAYSHLPELGGLRRPRPDSPNTGWRNLSFRGYADHMQTADFENGLLRVLEEAERRNLALMCAEAVPWRCHRSLIADALLGRGVQAYEISSASRAVAHQFTPFARVEGSRVTYPPAGPQQESFFPNPA